MAAQRGTITVIVGTVVAVEGTGTTTETMTGAMSTGTTAEVHLVPVSTTRRMLPLARRLRLPRHLLLRHRSSSNSSRR